MQSVISRVTQQLEGIVLGKEIQIKLALACLLAKGHLLIEDLPGMGKTTLAHALADILGLSYQRLQFTSDMLPSDVVGISIFDENNKSFELHKGPIFNQVVLADEINRANPKTQSALLEAMAEKKVSIDGKTHTLSEPFFVIATQNPQFHSGTFPLPESQLDRFMMRISLGFPDKNVEKEILRGNFESIANREITQAICDQDKLSAMQKQIDDVHVSDQVLDYILDLLNASRHDHLDAMPLSPRAGIALLQAAKAWAFMSERDFVQPDDVKAVFVPVCQHRLSPEQRHSEHSLSVAEELLNKTPVIKLG